MDDQPTVPLPEASAHAPTQVMPAVDGGGTAPPTAPQASPPSDGGRRRTQIMVAIIVMILLAGACGAAFVWQRRQAQDAERRAAEAEQALQDMQDESSREPTTTPSEPEEDADEEPVDDDSGEDAEGPEESDDGRFIGYITDIYNVMQSRRVKIDYIQFLTGDEAAAAASAHGDESPPPNDYYILNENPRIRDFNVREGLQVTMWTWNMPSDGVTEQSIPFDIWWDAIEMGGQDEYLVNPYWVTIDNGTVIEIEEQFLP